MVAKNMNKNLKRYDYRERAVNTLQQFLAHRRSVIDALKTIWERRVDAMRTL